MNRNNERHFNQIPKMEASRTRFNRDQTILTTFDSGKLIPFYVDEVLPGDTFNVDTSAIIRMTTPKYPVMDDAFIDFYYFYCPNRILWDDFKNFMGEVESTPWMPAKTYRVPQIRVLGKEESPSPFEGSILDYMGVPTKIKKEFQINALPIRGYVMIWNEFFRDENVDNAATIKKDAADVQYADKIGAEDTIENELLYAINGGRCLPVNKYHDYFSSCLPYAQRGPEVILPMDGNATVYYGNANTGKPYTISELVENLSWNEGTVGISATANTTSNIWRASAGMNNPFNSSKAQAVVAAPKAENGGVNLVADLATVTAATINDLRKAVAVQQYYEALARGGSRYREQVQTLWDVVISDKTVQVPEYLGGGRYHVNINQIVQTSGQQTNADTPIGETGAMSVTPINESSFTKSFEEHGFVIGVCCVRHNHSYQQGWSVSGVEKTDWTTTCRSLQIWESNR